MNNLEFIRPDLLKLLPIVFLVPLLAFYIWKNKTNNSRYQVSTLKAFANQSKPILYTFRHVPFALRIITILALIIAISRPRIIVHNSSSKTEGISIAMAIDISTSMLSEDFRPNRLKVALKEATNFISSRPNDRIAIVAFAGESFTQCPLTTDHTSAINLLQQLRTGLVEDGTAIGLGLANAIARLKDDDAKSKVIILLTDGVNNRGEIAPLTAADMAASLGIRVYTIGIGTQGMAPYPVQTPFGVQYQQMQVEIDEQLLQQIADKTGGHYFRATDQEKLKQIYSEIDRMEKTIFEKNEYVQYKDFFMPFLIIAFISLILEIILSSTIFRTNP